MERTLPSEPGRARTASAHAEKAPQWNVGPERQRQDTPHTSPWSRARLRAPPEHNRGSAPPAPLLPVRATPKPTCQDDSMPVPRGLACPPEGPPVSPLSSAVVCNLPCLQHQEPSPLPWRGLHPGLLRAELVGAPGRCLPKGEGGEFLCVRKKNYMTPRPSQGQRCPTTLPGHPGTDGRLGRRLGSTCCVAIQVLQGTNPDTCP